MGSKYFCDRCKEDVLLSQDLYTVTIFQMVTSKSGMIAHDICVHCKEKVKEFITTPEMDDYQTVPGC